MRRFPLLLLPWFLTLLPACSRTDNTGAMSYQARGVIQQITPDRRHATIAHEAISGYMPAMIMDFPLRDTNELAGIAPADEITFTLMVRSNEDWIENVRFVAHSTLAAPVAATTTMPELKPGDLLPDAEVIGEDGKSVHLSDFRGRALAFTFFFTRCPLPDYCLRMNHNFADARKLLLADAGAPTNWELLSISFDTAYDSPMVISAYADYYREGNTRNWAFATSTAETLRTLAPRLDLMIMRQENGSLSHNLRTVVLDPQGRIFRQFDGNEWTPQELAGAVKEAARQLN